MAGEKQLSISYMGTEILFTLQKSRRKTIALRVKEDGTVVVKAPNRVSRREVKRLVEKHAEWIVGQQKSIREQIQKYPRFSGTDGEKLWYFGERLTVRLVSGDAYTGSELAHAVNGSRRKRVWRGKDTLYVRLSEDRKAQESEGQEIPVEELVCDLVEQWYRKQAKDHFAAAIAYYERQIGVKANRLFIKNQKSRWGSCSTQGNINLNWRLLFAPKAIGEYVVVHELCHLKQMNHSRRFWQEVESVLPDYRERRRWLKEHEQELVYR